MATLVSPAGTSEGEGVAAGEGVGIGILAVEKYENGKHAGGVDVKHEEAQAGLVLHGEVPLGGPANEIPVVTDE